MFLEGTTKPLDNGPDNFTTSITSSHVHIPYKMKLSWQETFVDFTDFQSSSQGYIMLRSITGSHKRFMTKYHKRLKLSKRKVSQFTGFHSNVGKTYADLVSSILKVLKKAIAQKIHWENFRILSKICKNLEIFLTLNLAMSFMIICNFPQSCHQSFVLYGTYIFRNDN